MPDLIAIADGVFLLARPSSRSATSAAPVPAARTSTRSRARPSSASTCAGAPAFPPGLKSRAARLAGSRLTNDGVIVITASESRSQPDNRDEAVRRLVELLRRAAVPPKRRVPTRPTLGSKVRRLTTKTKRGEVKRGRANKPPLD